MEKETAKEFLIKLLSKKNTIYSLVRHISKSGMCREIDFFCCENNDLVRITYEISKVLKSKIGKTGGIRIKGCNTDLTIGLINELSMSLFDKSFSLRRVKI